MPNLKYLTLIHTLAACVGFLSACGSGSSTDSKVSVMSNVETINSGEELPTPQVKEPSTPILSSPEPTSTNPNTEEPQQPIASSTVRLIGSISYDRVNFDSRLYRGLDYNLITAMPVRGVTVHLRNNSGAIIGKTQTNNSGEYQFNVASNTIVSVRVVAELLGQGSTDYSIQVKDNTKNNALFVLDGSSVSIGNNATQTRNLHAQSGWDGSAYSDARSSAPFAILDSIYDAMTAITEALPTVALPPLDVFWSEKNIAISGNASEGKIGTSYYTSDGPSIYLLGAKNNDSDEFDRGVVQHEFGHYIEHQLSRTESLGGSHNVNSHLDLRVAFGEAWGNAFSGMVSGDPVYRDSLGANQSLGFAINVESLSFGLQGWFSEGTIQGIFYNLFDDQNYGDDTLSLGFKPIFDVLISREYLEYDGFASIYPFIDVLKRQNPSKAAQIDRLMKSYDIYGTGMYGENESNGGGSFITLPLYNDVTPGQTTNVCSDSVFQNYNGIDVYRFVKVTISQSGNYTVSAVKASSFILSTNPQIRVYQGGELLGSFTRSTKDFESGSINLSAGTYILEVFEQSNADTTNNNGGGLACFDVTVN